MTERLDRIENTLATLSNTLNVLASEFVQPNAQQIRASNERLERVERNLDRAAAQQAESIDRIAANEQQIARNAEALAQTRESIQANIDALAETTNLVRANEQRFEVLRAEANADRQRWEARAEADRQRWEAQAEADRQRWEAQAEESRRRFDAAQQVMQTMLVELSGLNGRVENLERAS